MKKQASQGHSNENGEKIKGSKSIMMKKSNKKKRLGGGGLSLEAFANAKAKKNDYNPSIIKKQREFYKNAKCVSKYKKSLKPQNGQHNHPSTTTELPEDVDETGAGRKTDKKNKKNNSRSLGELYERKRGEEAEARMKKEAIIQAKKEVRERSEGQRKAQREKMFKKTRSGQPIMKYRIEHLLKSIQDSTN